MNQPAPAATPAPIVLNVLNVLNVLKPLQPSDPLK